MNYKILELKQKTSIFNIRLLLFFVVQKLGLNYEKIQL